MDDIKIKLLEIREKIKTSNSELNKLKNKELINSRNDFERLVDMYQEQLRIKYIKEHKKEIIEKIKSDRKTNSKRNSYHYYKMKIRIFNHYSNYNIKCNCCGERHMEFLSLDHMKNNGAKHRKTVKSLYPWIIKNNFPPEFQVLCMNCNLSKAKDKEHLCIHQKERLMKALELDFQKSNQFEMRRT